MSESDPVKCLECGSELPRGLPRGLCPICALREKTEPPSTSSVNVQPPVDGLSADQIYERRWAETVLKKAMEHLQAEYAADGKAAVFDQLKDLQPGEHGEKSYADIAAALGITEKAVKNAVLRFRRRYAQLLRDEIGQTVPEPGEVNEELKYLMRIFAR